ncbi:hypothetical protein DS2_10948 [Catenovulum agarivorans DS-2]|uniref:Uncharacterized protein n=1 Tax=Catenovulum agarivorans DS-2 TaxID=1328313 RepID=W7QAG4_9ALTE|nr:hypothetical protein DS2_10948 [Catenovulum agarivorans DS-2]
MGVGLGFNFSLGREADCNPRMFLVRNNLEPKDGSVPIADTRKYCRPVSAITLLVDIISLIWVKLATILAFSI